MEESKTDYQKLTSKDLYRQFEDSFGSFAPGAWTIGVFEGSPEDGLYSWCPDCVVASTYFREFERRKRGLKLLKFKVGTRKEWESESNPFRAHFPHISDVPTAVLFYGKLDVLRVIAPRETDLQYMVDRAKGLR